MSASSMPAWPAQWHWRHPDSLTRAFDLVDGDDVGGHLRFTNRLGLHSRGSAYGLVWDLHRLGIVRKRRVEGRADGTPESATPDFTIALPPFGGTDVLHRADTEAFQWTIASSDGSEVRGWVVGTELLVGFEPAPADEDSWPRWCRCRGAPRSHRPRRCEPTSLSCWCLAGTSRRPSSSTSSRVRLASERSAHASRPPAARRRDHHLDDGEGSWNGSSCWHGRRAASPAATGSASSRSATMPGSARSSGHSAMSSLPAAPSRRGSKPDRPSWSRASRASTARFRQGCCSCQPSAHSRHVERRHWSTDAAVRAWQGFLRADAACPGVG